MLVSVDGLVKFQDKMVLDAHGRELDVVQFLLCSHYGAKKKEITPYNHSALKEAAQVPFSIFHANPCRFLESTEAAVIFPKGRRGT